MPPNPNACWGGSTGWQDSWQRGTERTKLIYLLGSLSVEILPLVATNRDQASGQGSQ